MEFFTSEKTVALRNLCLMRNHQKNIVIPFKKKKLMSLPVQPEFRVPNSTSDYLASKRLYRNLKAYKIYFYFRKKFFGQKTPFFHGKRNINGINRGFVIF